MVKKALLVGLNYPDNYKLRLSSSYNDLDLVEKFLIINENFNKDDIIKLTDKKTSFNYANYFNIIDNMKKRVNNSKSQEFETAINEIHKIAKLRIKDLPY